jgi:hypothetical protein
VPFCLAFYFYGMGDHIVNQDLIEKLVREGVDTGTKTRVRKLYGRVCRSKCDRPVVLAEERDRRVTMVMGPSGVEKLFGKSGFEMLVELGHTAEYIQREVAAGTRFSLVLFHRQKGMATATWDNVLKAVAQYYPEVADIVAPHAGALRRTAFADWQEQAGFSLAEIHARGAGDPRFMTVARLQQSKRDALAVRRFLYHVIRLTELFSGDGYTRRQDGTRGVREYVVENKVIACLGEQVTIDLDVQTKN